MGFPGGSEVKASASNVGDPGSVPGSGRSPGEGNGNPLQYSCLENPMDGEAWWAIVHGVAKSRTRLSDFTIHYSLYINILTRKLIKLWDSEKPTIIVCIGICLKGTESSTKRVDDYKGIFLAKDQKSQFVGPVPL